MANSASPLDFFRRHKGLVMGTMLLAMVLFVMGNSLDEIASGLGFRGNSKTNPVVFTWTGGQVHELEMQQMRQAHAICVRFVSGIVEAAQQKGGTPRGVPIPMSDDEDTVVGTLLLAEKAKRMGVTVTQDSVLEYLRELSGLALTDKEIADISERASNGQMSMNGLIDQLKFELLAQHMRVMLQPDSAISVSEAWDYHNRLYRRVSVEAYPINVADFVDKVEGQPSEADKRTMFDKYQYNSADPDSPDPGFFRPAKLSFDYLKVDFAPFLKKAQEEITEEEIKKEYDNGVEHGEYKVPVTPEKKPEEGKTEEGKTEDKTPAAETKPEGEKKEEKAEEKKADDKPAEGPKECVQDEKKEEEPKKEETKAADPATPAADPAKPAEPATDTTQPAADPAKPTTPAVPAKPEMRVQTLDEVRDAIRTRLAQPKAQEARNKVLEAALKELNTYAEKYFDYTEAKTADDKTKKLEEPKPLDVEDFARRFGFEGHKVPLVNRYEVEQYELGKDGVIFRDINTIDFRNFDPESFRMPFAQVAFQNRAPNYAAQQASSDSQADVDYIYWVTGSQEAEKAQYDDKVVQEAIVDFWKKGKAVELAKKAAEEWVKKAEGKETLKEVLTEDEQKKLISPPPFSWFTVGSVPFGQQRPRLSKVDGIDLAGDEFMQPVCTAPEKATVVAVNYPRSTVYAVKVLTQMPNDEVLRFQFQSSGISPPIRAISGGRAQRIYFERMEEIVEEFSLKWNRAPNSGGGA